MMIRAYLRITVLYHSRPSLSNDLLCQARNTGAICFKTVFAIPTAEPIDGLGIEHVVNRIFRQSW